MSHRIRPRGNPCAGDLAWLLLGLTVFGIAGCGGDGGTAPQGNDPPPGCALSAEILATNLDEYWIEEPHYTPDGAGGFYFMDSDNFFDTQTILHVDGSGSVTGTGIDPNAAAANLGYQTYYAELCELGCDADGWVYCFLSVTDEGSDLWILRARPATQEGETFATASQIDQIYDAETGNQLGAYYLPYLRTQLMVRPDGTLWLYANNGESHVATYLYYEGASLFFRWWQIPTPTQEPDHHPKVGLAADGDLLVTDIDAAVVWRCDADQGVQPLFSLAGFPSTISGFAQDDSGAYHFATNFVLHYDVLIQENPISGTVSISSTYFTEGIDWLLYAPPSGEGYDLFGWESTALTDSLGRQGVPGFWRFYRDPVSGAVVTMDEDYGDIYGFTFTPQ